MNEVLVDTNILVYSVDRSSRFHEKAQQFLFESAFIPILTSKNIAEFLCAVTKSVPPTRIEEAIGIVKGFRESFDVLYPNELSDATFDLLLSKYKPAGIRIHDFEIIAIGLAGGVNNVLSENRKDLKSIQEITLHSLDMLVQK